MNENKTLLLIIDILLSAIKEGRVSVPELKDLIEQRKIDVGNLPEVAEIEGNSYIHISNKTLSNRDNKISFPSFVNSITELPHVNVPSPIEDKHIANKEYVDVKDSSLQSQVSTKAEKTYVDSNLNLKANIASPNLTGVPTAPTASTTTNSSQIATTAFVKSQDYATNESIKGATEFLQTGYTKLPSGLIIQWGYCEVPPKNNLKGFYFPIAFPNACLNMNAIMDSKSSYNNLIHTYSLNKTYAEIYISTFNSIYAVMYSKYFYYQAIGY